MSTFLKSWTDIPKAVWPQTGGDDKRPAPGEAFVYLGTRAPLAVRHDSSYDRRETVGTRRYVLNLEEVPVKVNAEVRLPLDFGSVTAQMTAYACLWADRDDLIAYAQDSFDPEAEVRRVLAEQIEAVGKASMIKLDQDCDGIGRAVAKTLERPSGRGGPRKRTLRLTSVQLTVVMDDVAKRRLAYERKKVALERDIEALGYMDRYRPRLIAANTAEDLDAIRASLNEESGNAARLTAARNEVRELRDDLRRRYSVELTGHQVHLLERSDDLASVLGLRDELNSRLRFEVSKARLVADIRSLGLEREYSAKLGAATAESELDAIRATMPEVKSGHDEIEEIKRQCRSVQRELSEKFGVEPTPGEARELGEVRDPRVMRELLERLQARLEFEDVRRRCRALRGEIEEVYQASLMRDEISDLENSHDLDTLNTLHETLKNRREIYRLSAMVREKNMMVPEDLINSVLASNSPEGLQELRTYIQALGQAADILQFRSDLVMPEPIRRFFFSSLRDQYVKKKDIMEALESVLRRLVGPDGERMGLLELITEAHRRLVGLPDRPQGEALPPQTANPALENEAAKSFPPTIP